MSENIELDDDMINVTTDDDELDTIPDSDDDLGDDSGDKSNDDHDDGETKEDEGYGKKVQKRINKLVAERNVEREENKQLVERISKLEEKADTRDKDREKNEIDDQVADIKRRKMEFMDVGNYEQAEELNDELLELKIRKYNEPKPNKPPETRPEERRVDNTPGAQKAWMDGNDWYGSDKSSPKAQYANALYMEIVNEGYDPEDSDTYSELDKRLGNTQKKQGARPPGQIAPDRGGASGGATTGFTQRDRTTMRDYGLNPNDPAQRKEWLNNKRG